VFLSHSLPRRRTLLPLALLAALAACTDQPSPMETPVPEDAADAVLLQTLSCTVDVRATYVACTDPEEAPPTGAPDGLSRIILNPAGKYVRVNFSNQNYSGGILTFDATVQNLLVQTLSVSTSGVYDNHGVRVFFTRLPVATSGSGTITVNNAEVGSFTTDGQLFYRYPQTLATNQTSAPRQWNFSVPATVTTFSFSVQVAAKVQYPFGWIEIKNGSTLAVERGASRTLGAVVRDERGVDVTASAGPITWTAQDVSVATFTGNTLIGAAVSGITTITATAGNRTGSARIIVGDPFVRVSGGRAHTCGLTNAGRVYCWGDNAEGQLGDGTQTTRLTPRALRWEATTTKFIQVSAGINHTCALTITGQAWCWGSNASGQLGDNTVGTRRLRAVAVQQGSAVYTKIAAGDGHTCALTQTGQIYCWGANNWAQLGDRTTIQRLTPVAYVPASLITYADVTVGREYTCGRSVTRVTWCWGNTTYGQSGNNNSGGDLRVRSGTNGYVEVVSGGYHVCGRETGRQTYCWGRNNVGQLGDNTTTQRYAPVPVGQSGVIHAQLTAGQFHTCARSPEGQAWCWGSNIAGQLGDNTVTNRSLPVAVQQGAVVYTDITAGSDHTCGRSDRGRVFCWGLNGQGRLGDNSTTERHTPVAVQLAP
jgi:alpha-tubulin suppressor-like RCC1 family protein